MRVIFLARLVWIGHLFLRNRGTTQWNRQRSRKMTRFFAEGFVPFSAISLPLFSYSRSSCCSFSYSRSSCCSFSLCSSLSGFSYPFLSPCLSPHFILMKYGSSIGVEIFSPSNFVHVTSYCNTPSSKSILLYMR